MSENNPGDEPRTTAAQRTADVGFQKPADMAAVMAGSPYPPVNPDGAGSVLLAAARTGGRATVIERGLRAGAATLVRQMSTEDLAYVVLEGTVQLEVAGRVRVMPALSVECIRAGAPHRYRALTGARLLIAASPAGVEQLLLHEERLAREDPELLMALAQEHGVELRPGPA